MAAPYQSILQVPDFVPRGARKDYEGFLSMKQDTEGQRRELGLAKMDTLQAMLGKIPGLEDMYKKTTNLVSSMLAGEVSQPMQQILQQQGAALSAQHGVGGSQAGANIALAGLGKEAVRMQQQGLLQVPQILNSLKSTFMGNIASSEDVQGPSWQSWQGQQQADTRDAWQSNLAKAKAVHQVAQMNEQYTVQENQRIAAQARMDAANRAAQARADRMVNIQMHNQVAMGNNAAYASGMGPRTRQPRMIQSTVGWGAQQRRDYFGS